MRWPRTELGIWATFCGMGIGKQEIYWGCERKKGTGGRAMVLVLQVPRRY